MPNFSEGVIQNLKKNQLQKSRIQILIRKFKGKEQGPIYKSNSNSSTIRKENFRRKSIPSKKKPKSWLLKKNKKKLENIWAKSLVSISKYKYKPLYIKAVLVHKKAVLENVAQLEAADMTAETTKILEETKKHLDEHQKNS